jgi:hypothetical protein
MLRRGRSWRPLELKFLSPRESWLQDLSSTNAIALAPALPVRLLQAKQTGSASRRPPSTCPTAASRPRTALGTQHLRGPAGVTHTKAPCASALGDRQPGRRHCTPTGQGGLPRAETHVRTLHPAQKGHPTPWFRYGAPLDLLQPAPPKGTREEHRPLGRSLQCRHAVLSAAGGAEHPFPSSCLLHLRGWRASGSPRLAHLESSPPLVWGSTWSRVPW